MSRVLAILLSAAAVDPNLSAAENAFSKGDYDRVLPLLKVALDHPLPREQLARAWALEGHVHVAFERLEAATLAFRRVLGVDPGYLLEPDASPKLLVVFSEARRQGPIAPPPGSMVLEPKPPVMPLTAVPAPAVKEESSSKMWLLWTAIGAAVAGAAVGTTLYFVERPIVPSGSLGTGQLR
jgi:hypothetical protein